jgi:2-keto-myo-inositol isomerase
MKLALNGATIMPSPLADDVEIAAECRFDALEIWAGKIDDYVASHTLEELAERMRTLDVRPWCINSIEDITFRDADGRRELMAELERTSRIARAIGAPAIVVVPGRRPDGYSAHESVEDAADVLRAMSDVAGDIALAFEFLGKPQCAIPTIDLAIEVAERVDRAHVGMVIDTFHFYAGGSRLDDLSRLSIDKLLVVHLNGCEDLPREQLTDAHRLYPGQGPIPIVEILSTLRERGFDGVASVEIFRPEYWERDAREVARSARASAAAVAAAAGYDMAD